jgi:peroxiredoxin
MQYLSLKISYLHLVVFLLLYVNTFGQKVYDSATEVPMPTAGNALPNVDLISIEGSTYSLKNLVEGKKSIIILYRGGWCPYCSAQMAGLAKAEKKIRQLGYQIIGITGEDLNAINKFSADHDLPYRVFTDHGIALAKNLNIAYKVDKATIEKYKGYGIRIPNEILPIPTLIAVDEEGIINYIHASPDYKNRITTEEVLSTLKSLQTE